MSNVPEGAQLSEDGYYFWNGEEWLPVADTANGAAVEQGEVSAEELGQVTSAEQIDERLKPMFQPDYDMYADDTSVAETAAEI